jgi:hypothetical protein
LVEIKDPILCFFADNDCSGDVNILDVQRGLTMFNACVDDNIFNTDLNVVIDAPFSCINILDIQSVLNRFNETEPYTP